MKKIKRIWRWINATRLRKLLSLTLAILIFFTSIKYIFIPAPKVKASDVYIKFDEGYGTAPSDSNSAISAGTITNAVWKQEDLCKTGKCLYFDGTGDYVSFADNANLDFGASNAFTLEGWFRTPDITSGQRTLIAKHNATAGGYKVYMDSSGYLVFGIDDDSTWTPDDTASTTTTAFDDNKWHFFSAVKTETSITIYVDGTQYQTDSSLAATGTLANANTFYVGIDGNGSSNGFSGFLDEIRILRSAKTAAEVKADYTGQGTTTTGVGPVGWWKMDENTGTTAYDSSGNENTGTLTNGPTWGTGKYSNSVVFDGTDDNVTITRQSSIQNISNSGTIGAWIKPSAVDTNLRTLFDLSSSGVTGVILFSNDAAGLISFQYGTGSSAITLTSSFSPVANTWYYVTATWNSSGGKLYINGLLDNSNSTVPSVTVGAGTSYIGTQGAFPTRSNKGTIDDVRLYDYARSQSQIQEDMQGFPPSGNASTFGSDQSHLSDGLVGYWKMDETTANNCSTDDSCDSSGNGNNLAWNGNATTATSGKFGAGVTLDGTGDYLTDTINTSLSGSSFTIAGWVNQTSAATQTWFRLGSSFGNNTVLHLRSYSDGTILCGFYFNDLSTSAGVFQAGGWHHVACSYDSVTNKRFIYYDGKQVASDTPSSAFTGNTDLLLGNISGLEEWNGKLDEIRIYNKSLSSSEENQLYNFAPNPVGYWKLDESTSTTAYDSSGNGNNGTLTNSPTWATGKFGSGVTFANAATNQEVQVASSSSIDNLPQYTWSTWAKFTTLTSGRMLMWKSGNVQFYISNQSGNYRLVSYQEYSTTPLEVVAANGSLTTDTWYHLAVTWDGSANKANTHLYVNGVDQGQTAGSTSGVGTKSSDSGQRLDIGNNSLSSAQTQGTMDEVKIYNYARTPEQIIQDMNGGHTAPGSPVGSSVAKWKLDEGYGTTAHDNSINANDLTLSTASWTNDAKFGKAFNGLTNVRMSRADDADLDFAASDDFSFSLWFKSDSATNPSANEYLLEKGGNITTDAIGYAIYTSAASDGLICFGIDDDSTSFPEDSVCSTNDLYDNTWHHLVAEKTGASRLDLYVDGQANGTPDTSISATGTLENASTFYIGDTNGTDGTDEFLGDIDEVQVFRSALSIDEIKSLYNNASNVNIGSLSTDSSNNPSDSNLNSYCPPGQGSTCTGPVAEWKLDENTSTTANDSSGNANTGTITAGGGGWVSGKKGSAYNFDALATVVNAGSGSTVDAMAAITIEAWVYAKSEGENSNTWFINKASGGTTSPSSGWSLSFDSSGTNALRFAIDWNVSHVERIANDNTLALNQWQHVAVTWDGSNTCTNIHIYINGKEPAYQGCGTPAGGSRVSDAAANLYFGSNYNTSRTLDGYMDDILIYNYVRTTSQIDWDMNRGAPVGWWKMDENTGTSANDSAGNSTAGTLTNTPTWTTGKFNQGISFAGSNQQVLVADDPDFDFADDESMSITGWFKHSAASAQEIILSKYAAAGYKVIMESDGDITCGLDYDSTWTPTDSATSTLATYDDGNWHHFACVKNGATSLSLYIDGILITTDSSISATNTLTNADPLYFGIDADGTSNDYTGSLDDIRIYDYPLTAQQILLIMNNSSAVKYTQ